MSLPGVYDFDDCDEMTVCSLATLAEVRRRLAAHYGWDLCAADTVAGVVDEYAVEIVAEFQEDEGDDE